jgi:hypothetical protein
VKHNILAHVGTNGVFRISSTQKYEKDIGAFGTKKWPAV